MNERLRVLFCDHLSLMRGKFLPNSKIADESTRFCQSTFGVHFDKDLLPSPGSNMLNGLPDIVLNWQESEIRDSWLDNTKVVIGDLADSDGNVFSACARSSLKRAVSDWQKQGLNPKIGIELEAYAFVKEDDSWVPYSAPGDYVYATGPFGDDIGFNDEIWWKAEELGFKLEMITSEYDSSQFEYTLKFDDAVKAVDDLVLFKLMAREIALQKGVLLSFLPKPILESGGSGMHINMSFFDSEGQNQMSVSEHGGIENMTELSKQCVSGLVHHHEALAAILAPTANSYQRLQTASLSGFWKNWGGDHRNVTTRVSGEGGLRARIEHRMADASANPYLAVAAVLQAARLGTLNNYDLPPVETGDGFESNDAKLSVASSLKDAVDALERDDILNKAVGSKIIENHVFMKQQEVLKTDSLSPEEIIRFYLPYI